MTCAPRTKPGWLSPGALLGALGGLVVGGTLAAAATYEVVRSGPLPGGGAAVKEVEILGGVTLTVADERPGALDVLTALALASLAGVALLAWLVLRRRPPARRPAGFFGVSAVGASALAVDELEGLHETLGYNLAFLADLPGFAHPDDVLVATMALLAAAFLLAFRDLFRYPASARFSLLAALALLALGAGADAAKLTAEEPLEAAAAAAMLAAFAGAALRHAAEVQMPVASTEGGTCPPKAAARLERLHSSPATSEPRPTLPRTASGA